MTVNIKKLDSKRIFITGGTGFVGKNLLKFLIDHDIAPQQVTVLTRDAQKFKQKYPELCNQEWLDFEQADIRNLEWNNQKYDYLIHAATSVVDQSESETLFDEIVNGTKQALLFAKQAGVKSFINISSGAVYQPNQNLLGLTEDSPLVTKLDNQKNTYAIAKVSSEHLAYLASNNTTVKVTTLRCFCFAGAYLESTHFAIGEFVQKALSNEDIVVQAGSGIYRSYLAASDLAMQIFEMLILATIRASNYEVYNLGSDDAISLLDLAYKVVKVLGSESKVTRPNIASTVVNYYVPNANKLQASLDNQGKRILIHCEQKANKSSPPIKN
jgi:dTDP-glucose 4,6-dehydratase